MSKSRVNIIGAGLAGLSAAISLAEENIPSRLISIQPSERAQSVLAEGGINAALDTMGENDTTELHFKETMKAGGYIADEEAVRGLCDKAPEIVKYLSDLGVPFHRENGKIVLRSFGGQSKKRTAYIKSSTGKVLVNALIDEARRWEDKGLIDIYSSHEFVRLIFDRNKEKNFVSGVRVRDINTGEILDFYGEVILASGGLTGFFIGHTTGSAANTGDATAVAYAQGVRVKNLEMIQYHPTTYSITGKRCLISEAARGEGGRLYVERDGKPWYFMEEKYPELKNLMPRDVVSREIYSVLNDKSLGDTVYLDMTDIENRSELKGDVWETGLSDLRAEIIDYMGIDPAVTPVPVEPGIHYFMGGIEVDKNHRATYNGLYAAGECACQYHGANRLGGNSLLGAIYGGRVAAEDIAKIRKEENDNNNSDSFRKDDIAPKDDRYILPVRRGFNEKISEILYEGMAIVRTTEGLNKAKDKLNKIKNNNLLNAREDAKIKLSIEMIDCALNRKESLGAHTIIGDK